MECVVACCSKDNDTGKEDSANESANAEFGVRRSTRQKRLMYGSFNQNLIDKDRQLVAKEEDAGQNSRQRRKHQAQTAQGDVCSLSYAYMKSYRVIFNLDYSCHNLWLLFLFHSC